VISTFYRPHALPVARPNQQHQSIEGSAKQKTSNIFSHYITCCIGSIIFDC